MCLIAEGKRKAAPDKTGATGRMALQTTPRVHNTEPMSSHESRRAGPSMWPMPGAREYFTALYCFTVKKSKGRDLGGSFAGSFRSQRITVELYYSEMPIPLSGLARVALISPMDTYMWTL